MYVLRSALFETVRARGADIPRAEQIIFAADQFYELAAFILAVVWGCAAVANDLRLGAFQFYFARALRPRDYVAGKLLGLALLIGIPMFAGPVALSFIRLFLADGVAQAVHLASVVPRAIGLGVAGTAAYVLPVAGIGALARQAPDRARPSSPSTGSSSPRRRSRSRGRCACPGSGSSRCRAASPSSATGSSTSRPTRTARRSGRRAPRSSSPAPPGSPSSSRRRRGLPRPRGP